MRLQLLSFLFVVQIGLAVAETTQEVWVDVRSWAENMIDNIDGDPNFPYRDIVAQVREHYPDKSTPIRLYCARGGRAQSALELLIQDGYTNVENAGGIEQVRETRFGASDN